jgi:hypothetical protein
MDKFKYKKVDIPKNKQRNKKGDIDLNPNSILMDNFLNRTKNFSHMNTFTNKNNDNRLINRTMSYDMNNQYFNERSHVKQRNAMPSKDRMYIHTSNEYKKSNTNNNITTTEAGDQIEKKQKNKNKNK